MKTAALNIVRKKLTDVKPHPKNPRFHSITQLGRLNHSLERYGYAKGSLVVNKDGTLLAGHGILESLQQEGYTEADFVEVDLPPGLAEAFMVADNKLGDDSTWDMPMLQALVAELEEMDGVELEDTGFDLDEITSLNETDFEPVPFEESNRLDQKSPITCPHCGKMFVPDE